MHSSGISEKILKEVWLDSRTHGSSLATTDGRSVAVLDPGVPNEDGGPDFRNARIRIGGTLYSGDVELHCDARSWYSHGHANDGHYNSTILHVVFTAEPSALPARTRSGRTVPLLVIRPDNSVVPDRLSRKVSPFALPCRRVHSAVPDSVKFDWLETLARQRLELKVRRFERRLRELIEEGRRGINEPGRFYPGNPDDIPVPTAEFSWADFSNRDVWDQLLYEGIMEALGYSKNRWPFLTLAQSMKLSFLRRSDLSDSGAVMALLFGAAGLLPSTRTIANPESRLYLRGLRRRWRDLRPSYVGPLLQSGDWLFFRLRPSNFPTARLASACFLLPRLFGGDAFREVIATIKEGTSHRETLAKLHSCLRPENDAYWRHHYYFGPPTPRPVAGIGVSRRNDMIANVVIPIVLLYARVFHDYRIRDNAINLVSHLPPLQRNAITGAVERELFDGTRLTSALRQQGAIRLFSSYCTQGKCAECEIGKRIGM
jgi:hypothetical protein